MKLPSLAVFVAALFAATTGGLMDVHAAPVTFNTALPVAQGEFLFRGQFLFMKASDDPSPADRDVEVTGGMSVLGYGVTSDLALDLAVGTSLAGPAPDWMVTAGLSARFGR